VGIVRILNRILLAIVSSARGLLFVTNPNYKGLGPKNVLLTIDYFGQSKSIGDIS
jgi:hypothetical protein